MTAKKVGRFKIRDNERSVSRCADHEEEFMSALHDDGEEPKVTELNEPGGFVGAPATVDEELSPMQRAMQAFKTASDRRHHIGRAADDGPIQKAAQEYEGTMERRQDLERAARRSNEDGGEERFVAMLHTGKITPIQRFRAASDRKNNVRGAADRNSAADARTPAQRFVQASNLRHGLAILLLVCTLPLCRAQSIFFAQNWTGSLPAAATPAFSPTAGTYSSTQSVTITDSTSGATIYYTTDGSTPTTGSTVYSTAISVSTTTTVKAIATASGHSQSAVGSAAYTISAPQAATPTFTPTSPYSGGATTVTISDSTPGASTTYCQDTNNTCTPATSGSTASFSATGYIRAFATASGYSQSSTASWQGTLTGSSPTFVQSCGFNSANFSPTQLTCSGVTAGDTLVFGLQTDTATTISGCTDSSGNTVTTVATGSTNSSLAGIFAVYNASAGTHTVHCTFASGDTIHSQFLGDEYGGVSTTPADGSVLADCSTSGATCSANPSTSPAFTTTHANDLIWGFCYMASGSTGSTTSPITYTMRTNDSANLMWTEDGVLTTAGSIRVGCYNQYSTSQAAFLGLALHP